MGNLFDIFCFANLPDECEFVHDGAEFVYEGEFQCHLCDIDGTQQAVDNDLLT